MIVCTSCGTRNHDDERFCGECGAFLEWAGTPSDPPPAAAPEPDSTQKSETTAESAPKSGAAPEPGTESGTAPESGTESESESESVSESAPAPAPVSESEVRAVQPGRATTRRPVRRVAEPAQAPVGGGRACPSCGTGNDPTRRFCRACGHDLAGAAVVRWSWWRRLLDRMSGRRADRQRPTRRSTGMARRLVMITAGLGLLAVLAVVGPPLAVRAIDEIRDQTQDPVPLTPTSVTASSTRRDSPAARISDGVTNRYWAPAGEPVGSWVEFSFAAPVRILDVVVHSGISIEQEKFLTVGRPDQLEVIATASDGQQVRTGLKLRDQPGQQRFSFEAADTLRVRLVVQSTYGPSSEPAVAIGEVEFFGRT